ncbi:hypothetical protein EW145_g5227 [Phellinidium pouzarii]|uniref:Uncharacterized protein n=1 Tax=Phellinidium pouzarii TaxID=167371 RepID=A0A4S4L0R2_9AGAM|nr:hypothetical protein EW145_g5227 [Phellinidium pouzarii]
MEKINKRLLSDDLRGCAASNCVSMGGDDLEREGLEHEGLEHEDIERDEGLEGSEGNEMELEDPEQDSHQGRL